MDDRVLSRQQHVLVNPVIDTLWRVPAIEGPVLVATAHQGLIDRAFLLVTIKLIPLLVPGVGEVAMLQLNGFNLLRFVRAAEDDALPLVGK